MKTPFQIPNLEIRRPNHARHHGVTFRISVPGPLGFRNLAFGVLLLLSTLVQQPSTCLAQYAINWHTLDGGGGTSTGGAYSVSGTIGQPDAGPTMTNGQYSLTGGFWVLPQAVQTEGAPTLTIVPDTPGNAKISWTPPSTNWVLQASLNLSPAAWTNAPSGSTNPVVVPATLPTKFYRLFKP